MLSSLGVSCDVLAPSNALASLEMGVWLAHPHFTVSYRHPLCPGTNGGGANDI